MNSIGVLASGSGTDLQSIIDASEQNRIDAQVEVVISDNKDAFALKRAEKHGIAAEFLNSKGMNRTEYDQKIDKIFSDQNVSLVVGAGYMRLLTERFVKKWFGKLINIHPALLPSFKGVQAQKDALEYGVKISGCTTHFVDTQMDHGPIILQAAVMVKEADTAEKLKKRILEVEHQILPRTIQLFFDNKLEIKGRCVQIKSGDSWKEKYEVLPDVLYPDGY
ncbi:MAG: phosphoribosylglycinamide formyltransferase [Candidatus Thermoplasmatota archaeon]|nr:phosphoribosylglycinamide formyltransferase [Candidatus Thermoplasmatota archaeon]